MLFRTLFISVIFLFILSCSTAKYGVDYFPKEVNKEIYFGMPLQEFKKLKGDNPKLVEHDDGYDFRTVFLEKEISEKVSFLGYYFDNDGDKPLYEILIGCKDEETRDNIAKGLLGPCNAENGKEWRFHDDENPPIKAWTFKSKIIIAAQIPDTEWEEEE